MKPIFDRISEPNAGTTIAMITGTAVTWSNVEEGLRIFALFATVFIAAAQIMSWYIRHFVCRRYDGRGCANCPLWQTWRCPGANEKDALER